LGRRYEKRREGGGYRYGFRYSDPDNASKIINYSMVIPQVIREFTRDLNGYLYTIATSSGRDTNDVVYKFDRCGKQMEKMQLPDSEYIRTPVPAPDPIGHRTEIVAEYGQAVVGPNGHVYTWKRTSDNYSIFKWAWTDSPDDPKGGPDAPVSLNAETQAAGINLSWQPSSGDPGCVTGYEIERSSSSGSGYSNIATVNAGVFNYTDETASAGQTWYYRVRAMSGTDWSDYSAEASASR